MNTLSKTRTASIDRSQTEAVLYRVAVCALTWNPGSAESDLAYRVDEDSHWCLEPLAGADPGPPLRHLVAATILDPSRHRTQLVQALSTLADE